MGAARRFRGATGRDPPTFLGGGTQDGRGTRPLWWGTSHPGWGTSPAPRAEDTEGTSVGHTGDTAPSFVAWGATLVPSCAPVPVLACPHRAHHDALMKTGMGCDRRWGQRRPGSTSTMSCQEGGDSVPRVPFQPHRPRPVPSPQPPARKGPFGAKNVISTSPLGGLVPRSHPGTGDNVPVSPPPPLTHGTGSAGRRTAECLKGWKRKERKTITLTINN